MENIAIGSVHLSESGTIAAFRGEKEDSQLDEKGNVFNTFNQLLTCMIDILVVLQKFPQLSDMHFSQVLNKLEKNFFHGFIKYHLALHFV